MPTVAARVSVDPATKRVEIEPGTGGLQEFKATN